MKEIKPVAWVERTEDGHDRMWSGSLDAWANRSASPEPLYDQTTIGVLMRDAERYRWLIENCSSNGGLGVEIFIGDEAPDATDLAAAIDAAMQGANT